MAGARGPGAVPGPTNGGASLLRLAALGTGLALALCLLGGWTRALLEQGFGGAPRGLGGFRRLVHRLGRDRLASRLTLGLVGRTGDIDGHVRHHLGMEGDADLVQPQRLDRTIEHHLTALDREPALGEGRGDVAGRDRAVELARVARLADDNEALAVEL